MKINDSADFSPDPLTASCLAQARSRGGHAVDPIKSRGPSYACARGHRFRRQSKRDSQPQVTVDFVVIVVVVVVVAVYYYYDDDDDDDDDDVSFSSHLIFWFYPASIASMANQVL